MAKIRAELKSVFAPFVRGDLTGWEPEDPENFGLQLQIFIGTPGSNVGDSFDLTVCTPSWLDENWDSLPEEFDGLNVRSGHDFIFMKRWDYQLLDSALRKICDVEANTWGDVANRISRKLPWEYDYRYDRHQDEGLPFP